MKKSCLFLSLAIYFILISKSYAYIDPGTGSMIIQAILGFVAAALATLSFYWSKFKLVMIIQKNKKVDTIQIEAGSFGIQQEKFL